MSDVSEALKAAFFARGPGPQTRRQHGQERADESPGSESGSLLEPSQPCPAAFIGCGANMNLSVCLFVCWLVLCSGNHSCSAGSVKYNDTDLCWGTLSRNSAYRVFLVSSCSRHVLRDAFSRMFLMWAHVLFWDFWLQLGSFNILLWSLPNLLLFYKNIIFLSPFLLPLLLSPLVQDVVFTSDSFWSALRFSSGSNSHPTG